MKYNINEHSELKDFNPNYINKNRYEFFDFLKKNSVMTDEEYEIYYAALFCVLMSSNLGTIFYVEIIDINDI